MDGDARAASNSGTDPIYVPLSVGLSHTPAYVPVAANAGPATPAVAVDGSWEPLGNIQSDLTSADGQPPAADNYAQGIANELRSGLYQGQERFAGLAEPALVYDSATIDDHPIGETMITYDAALGVPTVIKLQVVW